MLNHTKKIKEMYEEIQRKLLYIIPEKWESIYLYSSVIENPKKGQTGELFFYYIPKGIFRKNPVNVYEVPSKFNIDETQYVSLVQKLYEDIKQLREEFKKTTQGKMWTNLTISITNIKFRAEYSYEDLINNNFNSYERHVIWRYKYLGIGPEQVSKKDKEILYRYFNDAKNLNEVEEYSAGIYIEQDTQNIFDYNTQNDEFEIDGYITEEITDVENEKKYNQIQSHKIENNWDANDRKKVKTMWSHDSKSAKQYIIKPVKNNKSNKQIKKQEENILSSRKIVDKKKEQQDKIIKKDKKEEEKNAIDKNKSNKEKKLKQKKLKEKTEQKIRNKTKNTATNEEVNRPIRNQILFSEEELDEK